METIIKMVRWLAHLLNLNNDITDNYFQDEFTIELNLENIMSFNSSI